MRMCLHDSTLWFQTSKLHYHKLIAHVNNSQWGSSEHMHANVLARALICIVMSLMYGLQDRYKVHDLVVDLLSNFLSVLRLGP